MASREIENRLSDLVQSVVAVFLIQDGLFRYVNARFAEILGYTPEELIDRKKAIETVAHQDASFVIKSFREEDGSEANLQRLELQVITKNGDTREVEVHSRSILYQGRRAITGALLDITERKQTENKLLWENAFLQAQFNSTLDGILVIDRREELVLKNQRAVEMWGIPQEIEDGIDGAAIFAHLTELTKHDGTFQKTTDYLRQHPDEASRTEVELKNGNILDTYSCPVFGEDGALYGRIWTFRDITELRHYWEMLESISSTDGLTELSNRASFDTFLTEEWRRSVRDQNLLSLILLDIDFFKQFNDHYGHMAGDECLRKVAKVLREVVDKRGTMVARYGGEEFVCVLPGMDSIQAAGLAEAIRSRLAELRIPHALSSVSDRVTLSFGVATLIPKEGKPSSHLIQLADDLLYEAKRSGRDQVKSLHES